MISRPPLTSIPLITTTTRTASAAASSSLPPRTLFLSERTYIPSNVYQHPTALLLELCTSIKELQRFVPQIIKNGLYGEHYFQTKLVSLFCKFGSLTEAARVFEPIDDKVDTLYHTMLKG